MRYFYETFRKMAHKRIPSGRMGEVEEIANLACYLVSDYSSWISGEVGFFLNIETFISTRNNNYKMYFSKRKWCSPFISIKTSSDNLIY